MSYPLFAVVGKIAYSTERTEMTIGGAYRNDIGGIPLVLDRPCFPYHKFCFSSRYGGIFSDVRYMLSPVRLSSVCLSSVCLSVTIVRPTQPIVFFGNISTALGTLAIRWHPLKISRTPSHGNPSAGGVKQQMRQRTWTSFTTTSYT